MLCSPASCFHSSFLKFFLTPTSHSYATRHTHRHSMRGEAGHGRRMPMACLVRCRCRTSSWMSACWLGCLEQQDCALPRRRENARLKKLQRARDKSTFIRHLLLRNCIRTFVSARNGDDVCLIVSGCGGRLYAWGGCSCGCSSPVRTNGSIGSDSARCDAATAWWEG